MDYLNYLKELFGKNVVEEFEINNDVPLYLKKAYTLKQLVIFNVNFVAVIPNDKINGNSLKKQLITLEKQYHMPCIIISNLITSNQKRWLVKNNVMFIIPNKDIYIPQIGVILNENKNLYKSSIKKVFAPITQFVFLYLFYNFLEFKNLNSFTINQLVDELKQNKMNISRALNDLYSNKLIDKQYEGKALKFKFVLNREEFLEKGMQYLVTPVSKEYYIENEDFIEMKHQFDFTLSDVSTLSEISMLAPPKNKIYMIQKVQDKLIMEDKKMKESFYDEVKIQVYKYDTKFLSNSNIIDPISLYLSLQKNNDERTRKELDNLLRRIKNGEWIR
jgi:hypothetical protein